MPRAGAVVNGRRTRSVYFSIDYKVDKRGGDTECYPSARGFINKNPDEFVCRRGSLSRLVRVRVKRPSN